MNCKRAQKKIVNELASGESGFGGQLGQHLQNCAACCAFFANQAALFQAIDSHVHAIANGPMPPSLLPCVRVRLQEEVLPGPQGTRTWQLAAIAAVIVLSAVVGLQMHRQAAPEHTTESTPPVASSDSVNRARPVDYTAVKPVAKSTYARMVRKRSVPAHSLTPEIRILPEEQEAFRLFVSRISKDRDTAIALTSAAPENGEAPVEIALLTIKNVEVKPLEGTDSE
jgi:hypothetical protein